MGYVVHFCRQTFVTYFVSALAMRKHSFKWANYALIAQVILVCFAIIIVGIDGDFIRNSAYVGLSSVTAYTKYQILQAQIAFAVIMMFLGLVYIAIYLYGTRRSKMASGKA
ncbi:unnamed protein product [Didymodactylos carnosus]|uniref:Uncharacterized protein n=1 Tax=Didymodactylos carnosus TaxID=1234261 RepID=A0A816G070_9BILA|nr:unnamed protein product [Didymodactylos carnosus]CAF4632939.1 unnamed protein product [Didymodactylos carnosus]